MKTVTFNPDKNDITVHRGEETTDPDTGGWWGKTICGITFVDTDFVDTERAGYFHSISYCKKCYGLPYKSRSKRTVRLEQRPRFTPEQLERFHRLRGNLSVSDFILKMMDCYENQSC